MFQISVFVETVTLFCLRSEKSVLSILLYNLVKDQVHVSVLCLSFFKGSVIFVYIFFKTYSAFVLHPQTKASAPQHLQSYSAWVDRML